MKKILLLAFGLAFVGTFVYAATYSKITSSIKNNGDYVTANEFNEVVNTVKGINNDGTRLGINSASVPGVDLAVDGAFRLSPVAEPSCEEGIIYFDSASKHFFGCNSTGFVRLDNDISACNN